MIIPITALTPGMPVPGATANAVLTVDAGHNLAASDAATARAILGLGSIATHAAGDYLTPTGDGSGLTGLTGSQINGNIAGNAAGITGTNSVGHGGTGLATIAAGKLLYASALDTLAPLTLGTSLAVAAGVIDTVANTSTQRVVVSKAGTTVGTRHQLNLIEGSNVTLTVADNAGTDSVDVTVASTASGGGTPGGSSGQLQYNNAGTFAGIPGGSFDGNTLTIYANVQIDNVGDVLLGANAGVFVGVALGISASGYALNSTAQILWSAGAQYYSGFDVGIQRVSAGVLKINDGSTGSGALEALYLGLSTLADTAAPSSSLYLGSDHLDGAGAPKLCRKDSAGNVTVIG